MTLQEKPSDIILLLFTVDLKYISIKIITLLILG